ncbi:MAG: hypothetical protein H0W99_13045, partial [Acidobacteria bacterium]|nr:hypothetical protein [Acidobacteriota bacterium]
FSSGSEVFNTDGLAVIADCKILLRKSPYAATSLVCHKKRHSQEVCTDSQNIVRLVGRCFLS